MLLIVIEFKTFEFMSIVCRKVVQTLVIRLNFKTIAVQRRFSLLYIYIFLLSDNLTVDTEICESDTGKAQSHKTRTRLRLKSISLKLQDQYREQTFLVSTNDIETEKSQSQKMRLIPRLMIHSLKLQDRE